MGHMDDTAGTQPTAMARLPRPRAARETRLAVVADPHVGVRAEGSIKRFEQSEAAFRTALSDAERRGADAVLSPGDLTKDGEPWNYDAVDDALDALEVPVLAVPGNHDVPKDGEEHDPTPVATFAERYAPADATFHGPGDRAYPVHARLGGVDVVGLNSAGDADRLADTHEGEVGDEQRERAAELLAELDDPVVLTHYGLAGVEAQVRGYRDRFEAELDAVPLSRDGERMRATLAEADAPLALAGHLHLPAADRHGPTAEVTTPATCSFPQAYLLVDVGPAGTTVRFVPVADRPALEDAYDAMVSDSDVSRALLGLAATRTAGFPLLDDRA